MIQFFTNDPSFAEMLSIYTLFLVFTFGNAVLSSSIACEPSPTLLKSTVGYLCNARGIDSNPPYLARFQSFTKSYVGCENTCWGRTGCISFAYNKASNYCRLFSTTVTDTGYRYSGTSDVYYWNVKGCFKQPSPCSTSTVYMSDRNHDLY